MRYLVLLALALSAGAQPRWWEREPLRIIDLTTSVSGVDFRPPAEVAARKAALGYNAEHLEIMGRGAGLDDRHFHFRTKLAAVEHPDYLSAYLPEARKRGIRVLIYFNVHWYTMAMGEAHPDWRQIREDGTPVDRVYDTGTDFCVNSPWREWCFQVLRDLAAYPIDGIFYDGPIFRQDTCYCRHCRVKFRRQYGRDLPSKKSRRGRDFKGPARVPGRQPGGLPARLAPGAEVHQPRAGSLHERRFARSQLGHRTFQPRAGCRAGPAGR